MPKRRKYGEPTFDDGERRDAMAREAAKGDAPPAPRAEGLDSATYLVEEIRRRAWERYEQRGRVGGHELEDWLEAERELHATWRPDESGEDVDQGAKPR